MFVVILKVIFYCFTLGDSNTHYYFLLFHTILIVIQYIFITKTKKPTYSIEASRTNNNIEVYKKLHCN